MIFEAWAAPAASKTNPKGGGRSPLSSGMVFGAAGAAQTPKIDDCRPAPKSCITITSVGDLRVGSVERGVPKCLFATCFSGRPGATRPRNHTFSSNEWFAGLASTANKPFVSGNMCGFLALAPQASKTHLAPKTLRQLWTCPIDRVSMVQRRS